MKSYFAMGRMPYDENAESGKEIYINNLGFYKSISEDIEISRPHGRKDYHLIYVVSGEVEIGKETLVSGDFYIFYPNEKQNYIYKSKNDCIYYWIHFTGSKIPELLLSNTIRGGVHSANGRKQETDELFNLLTVSTRRPEEHNSEYQKMLFSAIINVLKLPKIEGYKFSRALKKLEDSSVEVTVGELSALYKMSEAHFIRSFKATYGISPKKYRINCILTEAKNLLTETAMTMTAIAQQCGFSDPLYFSRLFKKYAGLSPSEYRTKNCQ